MLLAAVVEENCATSVNAFLALSLLHQELQSGASDGWSSWWRTCGLGPPRAARSGTHWRESIILADRQALLDRIFVTKFASAYFLPDVPHRHNRPHRLSGRRVWAGRQHVLQRYHKWCVVTQPLIHSDWPLLRCVDTWYGFVMVSFVVLLPTGQRASTSDRHHQNRH